MDEAVRELVDGAYAAALDDTLWADWAWRITRLLGGVSTSFYVVEASGHIRHQSILHESVRAVERYVDERIGRLDPQIAYAAALRSPTVYTDTDHVDRDDPHAREYFSWQASNGRLQHYVTASSRLNGGTHFAGVSVHRHVDDGATPDRARRIMERLLPHFHRALELGFLHAEKLTAAYWDGLLTCRKDMSLLLDDDGKMLRATPALKELLARGDGLGCVGGRLTRGRRIVDGPLDAFIAALLAGSSAPRSCRLDRPSGKAAYVLTGYPLPRRARMLAPAEAAALVTVVDPASTNTIAAERWQTAYGLTSRETELASLLTAGHSIESVAVTLEITAATARVHLRNLFAKTGTNRQAELVLLLARLAG